MECRTPSRLGVSDRTKQDWWDAINCRSRKLTSLKRPVTALTTMQQPRAGRWKLVRHPIKPGILLLCRCEELGRKGHLVTVPTGQPKQSFFDATCRCKLSRQR